LAQGSNFKLLLLLAAMACFGGANATADVFGPGTIATANVTGNTTANLSGSSEVAIPGFFYHVDGALQPLSAPYPVIPSPADDGIEASAGDDLTAPNAVTAARLNRIVCVGSANVGYSEAAQDTEFLPSALEYDATIAEGTKANTFSLTLRMTLEYESAFPSEGMVVWMKKHQQFINDEKHSQLLLIETAFQDYVNGAWVSINTDIRYKEEAESVVQAVITSDSGQTAGSVSTKDCVEDAKLGPVGERGRILLTYFCDSLYSYAEMDVAGGQASAARAQNLVPLGLQLPWAAVDSPANQCQVSVTVRGPAGSKFLDPRSNILAYRDLQKNLVEGNDTCKQHQGAVLPAPVDGQASAWAFSRSSLAPKPTMVLAWLSVPDADAGWEQVDLALPRTTRAVMLKPSDADEHLLRVALPGGLSGHLIRCMVETEAAGRQPGSIRVHTDITISDASGSTGMNAAQTTGPPRTVRQCFNRHEERRLLKRLEAIPKLVEAGVLLPQDIWRQKFVVFDHGVKQEFSIESKVRDLDVVTTGQLLKALRDCDAIAISLLGSSGKQGLLQSWTHAIKSLRSISAGGATSFIQGAQRAKTSYLSLAKVPQAEHTTYVNFDTDGGNNCGPCYDAFSELVAQADVVQGHVLGVGSWVDQDCASRIAQLLKGSVHLSMNFPEDAAADEHLRQDLSRWIKVLRSTPISLKCSAGATYWTARHGQRSENVADCLFAEGDGLGFGDPDVSEMDYTKAVVRGLMAGESTTVYILSRLPFAQLANRLELDVGGVRATVASSPESLQGVALGHHWLSLFGASVPKSWAKNASALCTRLQNRIEDELSFSWNLPSTSGSTAALGRAKTEKRPPVTKEKQPSEPELSSPSVAPSPVAFGALRCSAPAGGRGGKGGCFSAPMAAAMPMGGAMLGAAAMPMAGAAAMRMGGAPQMGGPMGGGMMMGGGMAPMAASRQRRCSPTSGFKGKRSGPLQEAPQEAPREPSTPNSLLQISGHMRCGPSENPLEAIRRGLAAVKQLMTFGVNSSTVPAPAEDPLVSSILGAKLHSDTQAVHYGFTCDATLECPITGVRFKSTSTPDHDICLAARRCGNLAGAKGYRPIRNRLEAMRSDLTAILSWWWLLWPERGDLFSQGFLDLTALSEEALLQGISKLPSVPHEAFMT